jgi:hypothetical protein
MLTVPTTAIPFKHIVTRTTNSTDPECTTAVPGKYGRVDDYSACNAYYTYNPSFEAAILFTVLFGILTIAHVFQAFWYKKRFTWVVIIGVLFELTSFVCRVLGSRDQQNEGLATASQLLFLLAPLCKSLVSTAPQGVRNWTALLTVLGINAFIYMTFGRLVHYFHPDRHCAGLKAASIAKYFVWADVASFIVQAAGGMMLNPGSGADAQKIGLKIYMAGVGVQEGFIVSSLKLAIGFRLTRAGCIQYPGGQICSRHDTCRPARSNTREPYRLAVPDVDHVHRSWPHYCTYNRYSRCVHHRLTGHRFESSSDSSNSPRASNLAIQCFSMKRLSTPLTQPQCSSLYLY